MTTITRQQQQQQKIPRTIFIEEEGDDDGYENEEEEGDYEHKSDHDFIQSPSKTKNDGYFSRTSSSRQSKISNDHNLLSTVPQSPYPPPPPFSAQNELNQNQQETSFTIKLDKNKPDSLSTLGIHVIPSFDPTTQRYLFYLK
jgi:hypothetical protein